MHMASPVVEVLTYAASGSWGFGAGRGGDIGRESEVIGGPPVGFWACGASVFVSVFEVLLMVMVLCIGT